MSLWKISWNKLKWALSNYIKQLEVIQSCGILWGSPEECQHLLKVLGVNDGNQCYRIVLMNKKLMKRVNFVERSSRTLRRLNTMPAECTIILMFMIMNVRSVSGPTQILHFLRGKHTCWKHLHNKFWSGLRILIVVSIERRDLELPFPLSGKSSCPNPLSGIGGYPPPSGKSPLSSFWRVPF